MNDLPPGFTLDAPKAASTGGDLPPGFTLDAPAKPKIVGAAMAVESPSYKPQPQAAVPASPDDASRIAMEDPGVVPPNARPDALRPPAAMPPAGPSHAGRVASAAGEMISNIPQSAGNYLSGIYHAVTNPGEVLKTVGDATVGVASKLMRKTGATDAIAGAGQDEPGAAVNREIERQKAGFRERTANAVGQVYADRYGSFDKLGHTIVTDPVGFLGDASAALTLGGNAAAQVPGTIGKIGATAAQIGGAIDPLGATGNAVGYGVRKGAEAASEVLGVTTGAGGRSVRDAAKAGKASVQEGGNDIAATFRENKGGAPIQGVVSSAKNALDEIVAERGAHYRSGMVDLSKDRAILDFNDINQAIDKSGQIGKFKGANIEPAAKEINTKLRQVVNDWETLNPNSSLFEDVAKGELTAANFHTPEGLDALKRTIGNLRDSTLPRTPERAAAQRVYAAVKAEIVKQAPAYAKVMEDYEKSSDFIGEATRTLSLGEKSSADTAARKLLSATRNKVNTNYGERERIIDLLAAKDPTLPYAISGQALNSWTPRGGVAGVGAMGTGIAGGFSLNPWAIPALAPFSPRLVGNTVYYGGKALGSVENVADAMGITPARLRALGQAGYQAGRNNEITGNALTGQ